MRLGETMMMKPPAAIFLALACILLLTLALPTEGMRLDIDSEGSLDGPSNDVSDSKLYLWRER